MVFSSMPGSGGLASGVAAWRLNVRRDSTPRAIRVLLNLLLAVALWGGVFCLKQLQSQLAIAHEMQHLPEAIIGKWETADGSRFAIEFTRDGQFRLSFKGDVVYRAPYKVFYDEIELLQRGNWKEWGEWRLVRRVRFGVVISRDTLSITAIPQGGIPIKSEVAGAQLVLPPADGQPVRFKRVGP